ncbi:MAG TPA: type II secretion system F family protein [Patescibacteria group bacterium]|nr:type II secretion system F family protein [Patescibacteria group bacterium]
MFKTITLSSSDKLTLISNFATMLIAGIPILEAVDALLIDAKGNQKKILETVREDLMQGKHVYISFSKFPHVFDKVTTNILKAAEEGGTFEVVLKDLRENIKKEIEFNDKIRSALIYPALIFLVFAAVLLVILVFVIPRIFIVFSRLRIPLPLPTRILVFISDILVKHPIVSGICTLLIVIFLFYMYAKKKRILFSFLSQLPFISLLVKQIDLTRFTRSLFLLLSSGVPITTALELTQDVVVKKEIAKAISKSREMVLGGKRLSEGFKMHGRIIPSMMVKITEAGEKSGTLDKSMQDVSLYLDYQVAKTLQTITTLLEPIMLIVVGVLVGSMMFSIIGPIYNLIGNIGSR